MHFELYGFTILRTYQKECNLFVTDNGKSTVIIVMICYCLGHIAFRILYQASTTWDNVYSI
ncbi:hypothetical protein DJ90_6306 [Paenibacillus macerans]|uniref:Uncharacterized protein n=1 Tax=Paenibacillus macerans TaxID=44252 RepID=A0A090YBZ5_PAEMA|nr:hypothetical protein DJ90_6306 [Paenibacillus macerans]